MLELEADHRRHAEIENAIRDLKHGVGLNHLPSGRFAANAAWLAVQVMAHNLARWTARIGLGEQVVTTKDPPAAVLLPGRTDHPLGAPPHTASATALALGSPVRSCPGPIARPATPCLTAAATGRHPANRTVPANSRQSGLRVPLAASSPRYLALTNIRRRSQSLPAATEDRHRPPSTPNRARTIALPCPYRPFRCCIVIPSVDLGLGRLYHGDRSRQWR